MSCFCSSKSKKFLPDIDLTEADKECHRDTKFSLQQIKDMRQK